MKKYIFLLLAALIFLPSCKLNFSQKNPDKGFNKMYSEQETQEQEQKINEILGK